jgi:trans-aconitate methyltransferase
VQHSRPDDHAGPQDEQSWDDLYRERDQLWTGEPNVALVAEVGDLPPGTAFDAGAGEGGDAIWLARRGWTVTAADVSAVGLERARRAAARAGVDVDWRHLDLTREPPPGRYDLVTGFYLHLPEEPRRAVFAGLLAAVAPGGTLLIVGHHPADMPDGHLAERGWTAEELATSLDGGWVIDTSAARPRPFTAPDGQHSSVRDTILRAHRRPG